MTDFNEFEKSLKDDNPPQDLTGLLKALWWDAKGDWNKAHKIAQDIGSRDAAWVHAYLHRREGDEGNASYWYSRAGRPKSRASLDQEREDIVRNFLSGSSSSRP